MASAFMGGFAGTLKDIRLDKARQQSDIDKARAMAELQKEFEAEIIDSNQTRVVGSEEIRYNKFGQEISRRPLSAEEADARRAELEATKAGTRKSLADATVAEAEAQFMPDKISLERDRIGAQTAASRASAASSYASAENARGRLSLDQQKYQDGLTAGQEADLLEAQQYLHAATASDDISTQSQAEVLEAELEAAQAAGNDKEVRRLIRQIRAELHIPYQRATTDATTRAGANSIIDLIKSNQGQRVPGGN